MPSSSFTGPGGGGECSPGGGCCADERACLAFGWVCSVTGWQAPNKTPVCVCVCVRARLHVYTRSGTADYEGSTRGHGQGPTFCWKKFLLLQHAATCCISLRYAAFHCNMIDVGRVTISDELRPVFPYPNHEVVVMHRDAGAAMTNCRFYHVWGLKYLHTPELDSRSTNRCTTQSCRLQYQQSALWQHNLF